MARPKVKLPASLTAPITTARADVLPARCGTCGNKRTVPAPEWRNGVLVYNPGMTKPCPICS